MTNDTLLTFVADIASAHLSHNTVAPNQVPLLIESIYASLEDLAKPAVVVEEKREPAVSVRSSVKPDAITCLECGGKMRMLKRHLTTEHQLTPAEYRTRWNLGANYPMTAPGYSAVRREISMKIGLGRKPALKVQPAAPKKATRSPRSKPILSATAEAATDT